jgi:hypothetical protein
MRFWHQPSIADCVNFMSADDQGRVLADYRQNDDRLVQIKMTYDISAGGARG